jgi:hypothetical protein
MKKLFTISAFMIVGLLALMAWSLPENTPWQDKVSPVLLEKARQSADKINFMVMMKQEADVSEAKQLTTKDEKAWFVYNQLQQTAARSQSGIIALLEAKGAKYRSFYIVNAIQIVGDIELIQALAERTEVLKVMANPTMKLNQLPDEVSASTRGPEDIEWELT